MPRYGIKFEVTDQDRVDRALAHQPVFNTGRVGLAPEVPELKFQRQPVEAATPRSSRSDGGASVAGFGTTPQPMTDPDLFFAQQAGLVTDSMLEDNDEDSKSVHSATSSRVGADENDDTMSIGGVRGSNGAGGGAAGTAAGGAAANTSDDNGTPSEGTSEGSNTSEGSDNTSEGSDNDQVVVGHLPSPSHRRGRPSSASCVRRAEHAVPPYGCSARGPPPPDPPALPIAQPSVAVLNAVGRLTRRGGFTCNRTEQVGQAFESSGAGTTPKYVLPHVLPHCSGGSTLYTLTYACTF